jgi:WD40 repeat protein
METGAAGDELATLLLSANHSPSEPAERALFWLLSEQMQRYEELDLDGTLLVQAQAATSINVRKRLAAAAAASGRTEWLSAMQQCKPLSHFDTGDWTTTVELLKRAGDPNAIWHWALKAPPVHAQELLQAVPTGSRRNAEIREASSGLQSLASQLPEVPDRHYLLTNFCTHTLSGHDDRVRSIAWSPDGRCLASQCVDATIRLWHQASGACTHALSDHTGLVNPIAWSPDGRCLASSSWDKSIQLWNYDLYSLLTMPLSCYSIKHWSSLSALREQSMKLVDWQRPWLEFIAALNSLIHRFDVSLDNQSSKTASSNFDIEIDG